MNENIVVKEYTAEYQAQVSELILHIQQVEYDIPITLAQQPDLMEIERFYQQGAGNFWVALAGETVVGTVALLDIQNNQVSLRKMFVAADYRGKTYNTASLLLQQAFAWAQQKDIRDIYLGTTLQFVAAHRFYEKNGFQEVPVETLPASFPIMQVDKKFYKYAVPAK